MKKGFFLREVTMLLFILSWSFEIVSARHKCPKVPSPPGIMGIFSSSTLIPSGSVMAAARSSETLGCDRGHPSDNFYKPQKERVFRFLEDNYGSIDVPLGKVFILKRGQKELPLSGGPGLLRAVYYINLALS